MAPGRDGRARCAAKEERLLMRTREKMSSAVRQVLCVGLALCALGWAPAGAVRAEVIGVEDLQVSEAAAARQKMNAMLARDDVRAELAALGVDPSDAEARVAGLSDAEVIALATRVDEAPAGASFAAAVGGVLIVTFAVLFVTDLLGYTDVFPFVDPLTVPRRVDPADGSAQR
jgi:hypothetical protein